ncbi:fibronectin type III domain-containing protein 5 [Corvus kubaryi]|nr:fibronectin type III domain-containing protein 5 [Corvus kubaryi]
MRQGGGDSAAAGGDGRARGWVRAGAPDSPVPQCPPPVFARVLPPAPSLSSPPPPTCPETAAVAAAAAATAARERPLQRGGTGTGGTTGASPGTPTRPGHCPTEESSGCSPWAPRRRSVSLSPRPGPAEDTGKPPAHLPLPSTPPQARPHTQHQELGGTKTPEKLPEGAHTGTGAALLLCFSYAGLRPVEADSPSAPVNVTVKHLKANSAVVTWDVLEDEVVIGFAISQQKKDVRMLRFIQEVNTTTRSCALWDLEEDTEYIVHVQSISIQGQSPASEPVLFKTPREAEKLASKNKDEVTMKEMAKKNQQLRAGEILIIVVVLFMWAGVIALFCRQYDIIKDNEPNNSKEKAKSASENSTPEHQGGGLLRSKFPKNKPSVNIIEA